MNTIESSTATGIFCGDAPGLREFAEGYLGLPDREDEDRWWALPFDGPWWSARASKRHVSIPFVPLSITAGRDCVVRYLAERGLDYGWARDIPGALVEGVRRFVAGEEPLLGVRSRLRWGRLRDGWCLYAVAGQGEAQVASAYPYGWVTNYPPSQRGPETGDEGKALAEAVIRRRYWVTQ